jgi:hypothetical protein
MTSVYQASTSVLEPAFVEIAIPRIACRAARNVVPTLRPLVELTFPPGELQMQPSTPRCLGPVAWKQGSPVQDSALPIPRVPDSLSSMGVSAPRPLFQLSLDMEPKPPQTSFPDETAFLPFPAARPLEPRTPSLSPHDTDFRVFGYKTQSQSVRDRIQGVWARICPRNGHRRLILVSGGLLAAVLAVGIWPPHDAGAKVVGANSADSQSGLLTGGLNTIKKGIASRAGVQLTEDFRSGFDNWIGGGNASRTWIFDQTGFVQPSQLAIYRPSLSMSDYTMEFLGELDRKALTWVFRATDIRNHYVAKILVATPGPLPTLAFRRYAVIGGKSTKATETILPITMRGSMFQVRLQAQGSNFSVYIGDRLAAFWTDTRLPIGGVGFFSSKGENSRIRWVRVEHQYDVLGRICAYLSPSAVASLNSHLNGSWK